MLYTIFNKNFKTTHIRSKATYRLKIIARTCFIINKLLGFIYIFIVISITKVGVLNNGKFFFMKMILTLGGYGLIWTKYS